MRIQSKVGKSAGVVAVQLKPGTDVIEGIEEACRKAEIPSGSVVSCIGSLKSAIYRIAVPAKNKTGAGLSDPMSVRGPLEILSAQGTVGQEKSGYFTHLHAVLCDQKGKMFGGHLVKGECPVLVICEILILRSSDIEWRREYDPEVDFEVLKPF